MTPSIPADSRDILLDPRVRTLVARIRESFRVRENHTPVYVDIGENLARVQSRQHQIVFGRRGSGKSCLLVHFMRESQRQGGHKCIYIQIDEYKRLAFPDVLIRLLLALLEETPVKYRLIRKLFRQPHAVDLHISELRRLLDSPETADVTKRKAEERADKARAAIMVPGATGGADTSSKATTDLTETFRHTKLDTIDRHLKDYKTALVEGWKSAGYSQISVVLDDFYLLDITFQPDVIDYLHRLLRDTPLYLKVATVRHRTSLVRNNPQTIGVELQQDVEPIDLDRTLEDLPSTQAFLGEMLDSLGREVGIERASDALFNSDALEALTLASGGVPRDFLAILVDAIEAGINTRQTRWLTPTLIYKGAQQLAWQSKRAGLRSDVTGDSAGYERLLTDLLGFCLKEHKKTAFLVSQEDAQANPDAFEFIQQLMDFKLIHIVEQNTSAASGRGGRYIAYTLDFSFFMEPRLRKIETVEFWRVDEGRRRVGVREAPIFPLERARRRFLDEAQPSDPTAILQEIEANESSA